MTDKLVTIAPDASVAEALSLMEENDIHELPVMTNSTLKGWVSYHGLVRHYGLPPQTKVSSVMEQPPKIQKDAPLIDAAELMIHNNARALPVVDGKGKVVGILSRTDILRAAAEMKELSGVNVQAAMNRELETVDETEGVDKAVARLRDLHINQFLVLAPTGKLSGYVALNDLLRARSSGHAPQGTEHKRGVGSARDKGNKVQIAAFVKEAPSVGPDATLAQAIRIMADQKSNFVAVVQNGFALGVVSRSNIVERLARLKPEQGVLCQIVGLAGHVDEDTLGAIYDLAEHSVKKISPEAPVKFLSLHYKVYKAKQQGDSKFSLTMHLSTDTNFFVQKADAWNPMEATKAALDSLEQRIMNVKELRLEKRKGAPRRKAQFYEATR